MTKKTPGKLSNNHRGNGRKQPSFGERVAAIAKDAAVVVVLLTSLIAINLGLTAIGVNAEPASQINQVSAVR